MLEAVYLQGAMLLVLDRTIEGPARERCVVAFYRYKASPFLSALPWLTGFKLLSWDSLPVTVDTDGGWRAAQGGAQAAGPYIHSVITLARATGFTPSSKRFPQGRPHAHPCIGAA